MLYVLCVVDDVKKQDKNYVYITYMCTLLSVN